MRGFIAGMLLRLLTLMTALSLAVPAVASAATAERDPNFGIGGEFRLAGDRIRAAALQPDGKLVAAGETLDGLGDAIVWRRHGHDGSPDATFNAGRRPSWWIRRGRAA